MANVKSDSQNYTAIAETVRELTLSDDKYTPAQMPEGIDSVYETACNSFGCKEAISGADSLQIDYVHPTEHDMTVKIESLNLFNPNKLTGGRNYGFVEVNGIACFGYNDGGNPKTNFIYTDDFEENTQYTMVFKFYRDEGLTARTAINIVYTDGTQTVITLYEVGKEYTATSTKGKTVESVKGSYQGGNATYLDLTSARIIKGTAATEYTEHIENFSNLTLDAECAKITVNEHIALPSEYQQVDYIESNKTQYIDTDIKPTHNTGIDIVVLSKDSLSSETGKYGVFFGARYSSRQREFAASTYGSAGTVRFGTFSPAGYMSVNEIINLKIKNKIYTDKDGTEYDLSSGGEFESPYNLYLFALNQNGAIQHAAMQLYSCKIYDGDELIRDFVPCYRIADGVIGLYDLVGEQFYTNGGTGVFVKGEVVVEPIKHTYSVNEDGTVDGVKSIYPSMTLSSDTEGVVIEAEYFVDGQAKIQALTDTIISLGGEL